MANVLENKVDDLETFYWLAEDLDEFLSNVALGGMSKNLEFIRRGAVFLGRKYGRFIERHNCSEADYVDHILTAYSHARYIGDCARKAVLGIISLEEGYPDEEEILEVIYENLIFHEEELDEAA